MEKEQGGSTTGRAVAPALSGPGAPTWDQADTSHCSFLCLWQRWSRQTSWVLGLGSELQRTSGSSCALAEGLVLLQATDLFLHPFPQVREHCIGTVSIGSQQRMGQALLGVPGHRPRQAW